MESPHNNKTGPWCPTLASPTAACQPLLSPMVVSNIYIYIKSLFSCRALQKQDDGGVPHTFSYCRVSRKAINTQAGTASTLPIAIGTVLCGREGKSFREPCLQSSPQQLHAADRADGVWVFLTKQLAPNFLRQTDG